MSHKPPSDRSGTNVVATGVRAENVSDNSFDPPQRLWGLERHDRNAVQEAFEVVDVPIVEFACKVCGASLSMNTTSSVHSSQEAKNCLRTTSGA